MQTPSSSASRRRHRRHFRRRPPPPLRHNFSAQTFGLQVAQPRKCARGAEKNVPPMAISASTAAATCTNENQRTKDGLKIETPNSSPSSRDGRLFSFPVLLHFLWPLGATSYCLLQSFQTLSGPPCIFCLAVPSLDEGRGRCLRHSSIAADEACARGRSLGSFGLEFFPFTAGLSQDLAYLASKTDESHAQYCCDVMYFTRSPLRRGQFLSLLCKYRTALLNCRARVGREMGVVWPLFLVDSLTSWPHFLTLASPG